MTNISPDKSFGIAQDKQVNIICEDTIKVFQSHLFGVDHIKQTIPQSSNGNFMISIEGVAIPDQADPKGGKVPSLQTLDYYVSGNNLELVFNVLPGQTFQPGKITPRFQGAGFNLIFVIGSANLNNLGSCYSQNAQVFSGVHIVNIDNQTNTGFGQTNVLDQAASSISEMVVDLIPSLGLPLDADTASNLLAGIFEKTINLTAGNTGADTFLAVSNLLRAGGKKPGESVSTIPSAPATPGFDLSVLMPPDSSFVVPPVVSGSQNQPSIIETAEPDWLTPKIFKSGSVG